MPAQRPGARTRRNLIGAVSLHLLGADAGGDAEVRGADLARRQPRRGRRPRAHRAGRARPWREAAPGARSACCCLGVFGATLFYGDSVITPAISVLGAMEGLEVVATPALKPFVLPLPAWPCWSGCSWCSASAQPLRGPLVRADHHAVVRGCWRCSASCSRSCKQPAILAALNPLHACSLPGRARLAGLLFALGAIVLALTGAEALYADMGHFGRRAHPARLDRPGAARAGA